MEVCSAGSKQSDGGKFVGLCLGLQVRWLNGGGQEEISGKLSEGKKALVEASWVEVTLGEVK